MSPATPKIDPRSHYVEAFEAGHGGSTNGKTPPWIASARRDGIERFRALGFPTPRDERWRFTEVRPIERVAFVPADASAVERVSTEALAPWIEGLEGSPRLVFVDGFVSEALSDTAGLPRGVRLESLAAVLHDEPERLARSLGTLAPPDEQAFTALNQAFFADGAYVEIPAGAVLERPLSLLHLTTGGEEPRLVSPRHWIAAGANSQAVVIEYTAGLGEGVSLTNAVTEIALGENAVLDHVKVQREARKAFHVHRIAARQGRASRFVSHNVALGGRLVRNEIEVALAEEGAETSLNGLYHLNGRQHVDNQTSIDHVVPHCTSQELYKGILDDRARAVFNGKIVVRPDAQKSDARQTNKNLILSDETGVNSKPELEIFANDVKCAHGATVGQLDADALFYMKTRGIADDAARRLLIHAFASELIERLPFEPLQNQLEAHLFRGIREGERELETV